MAETLINNTLSAPAITIPASIPNIFSTTLNGGIVASSPMIAIAYSNATLTLSGTSSKAGANVTAECNGRSITVTLDSSGNAAFSLLPFIRAAVEASGALDNPLYCASGATSQTNKMRGLLEIDINEDGEDASTHRVFYIFGNFTPQGSFVSDVWLDYDANGETWASIDSASNYDLYGYPVTPANSWFDVNKIAATAPSGDFRMVIPVAWYYGTANVEFRNVTFHFRYDCRADNVVKVRWLDTNGGINMRKFTVAGRSFGASTDNSWQRPHLAKSIVNGYYHGRDEWASITASETLTIGDDGIPAAQYGWLKTLASSAAVEAYIGGVWVRCGVGDFSAECDPRKSTFSMTLALVLPTDEVQQF